MSWQRLLRKPSSSCLAYPNNILLNDIGVYLEQCRGRAPILNRTPFISIRNIAADTDAIHDEVASMEKTAQRTGRLFYSSFWVKDIERLRGPMGRPVVMSRTWLQPRAYDSIYWLSLFQVFDDTCDSDAMTTAAVSRWYPNEAELEKDMYQLR